MDSLSRGYLKITVDGLGASILGDFTSLCDYTFALKSIVRGKPNFDYFPQAGALVRERVKIPRLLKGRR